MRDPDLARGNVRAWHVQNTEAAKTGHVSSFGYADAGIATWIVSGPFHPLWSWWMVSVVHLREIEGAPPAKKSYPEAEYEFMILSMDPSGEKGARPTVPDVVGFEQTGDSAKHLPGFLQPPDAVIQFHGLDDDQAAELCKLSVAAIVNGHASPDSDFRSWWEAAIPNTVKHLRGEPH